MTDRSRAISESMRAERVLSDWLEYEGDLRTSNTQLQQRLIRRRGAEKTNRLQEHRRVERMKSVALAYAKIKGEARAVRSNKSHTAILKEAAKRAGVPMTTVYRWGLFRTSQIDETLEFLIGN